jgi:hypothetical protein
MALDVNARLRYATWFLPASVSPADGSQTCTARGSRDRWRLTPAAVACAERSPSQVSDRPRAAPRRRAPRLRGRSRLLRRACLPECGAPGLRARTRGSRPPAGAQPMNSTSRVEAIPTDYRRTQRPRADRRDLGFPPTALQSLAPEHLAQSGSVHLAASISAGAPSALPHARLLRRPRTTAQPGRSRGGKWSRPHHVQ